MKKTLCFLLLLFINLPISNIHAQGENHIYLEEYQYFYDTIEAKSRYDFGKNPYAKALGTKGKRNDSSGMLEVGTMLIYINKQLNNDGQLYYECIHPQDETKHIWLKDQKTIVHEDPRTHFNLKAIEGNSTYLGYLTVGVNYDGSGGSITEIKIIDDILGVLELELKNCIKIHINKDNMTINAKTHSGNIHTFSGKPKDRDIMFVNEGFKLNLFKGQKELELIIQSSATIQSAGEFAKNEKSQADPTIVKQPANFEALEIDFFLNRKVNSGGYSFPYKQFMEIGFANFRKQGLTVSGPKCFKGYENFIVRYSITGTSNDGKIWDENLDYEVNSQKKLFKPITELAIHLDSVLLAMDKK